MPSTAIAQRGGGGHAGGGHAGGGHFGGGNFGGGRIGGGRIGGTSFGGGRIGGARFGGTRGAFRGANTRAFRYPRYRGYGYGYGGYGYYPYLYGNYANYNGTYPYYGSGLGYDAGYDDSYGEPALSYSGTDTSVTPSAVNSVSFYPPSTDQTDTSAHLTVNVPAGAQVWFDDFKTTSTGRVREFVTPSLKPGKRFTYELRGSWNENGHEVTQTQKVAVTAGAHVTVNFPTPPKTEGKASAVSRR
jgi:uncharacterized protein (TIGR03000 family)